MSAYVFSDVTEDGVPLDPVLTDTAPPLDGPEYTCEVCGKPLTYSGRGRKPKRCDEHKRGASRTTRVSTTGKNATLASQATDALVNINSLAAFGVGIVGYADTADAINDRQEAFRTQVYQALLSDPELCRSILTSGAQAGRVSLIVAYAMLAVGVFPTMRMEHVTLSAERKARREAVE